MTTERRDHLPDPSREAVNTWLMRLSLGYLHGPGWDEVNKRAHTLAMGGRKFANENFADNPDAQEGFYAGLTYGLLGNAHFGDIERLAKLMAAAADSPETAAQSKLQGIPASDEVTGGDGGDEGQPPAV